MRRALCHSVVVLGLAFAGVACDNTDESIPQNPTAPTTITDTLTGRITVNGADTKTFVVLTSGLVTVTLKSVIPDGTDQSDATLAVGMALGTWNGSSCQLSLSNDNTLTGTSVIGQVAGIGTLCVRVYDVGKLTAPVDYTVDAVHY
jgi:hypothetical protein